MIKFPKIEVKMQNARDDGAKFNARDEYVRLKQAYQEEEAKLETLLRKQATSRYPRRMTTCA